MASSFSFGYGCNWVKTQYWSLLESCVTNYYQQCSQAKSWPSELYRHTLTGDNLAHLSAIFYGEIPKFLQYFYLLQKKNVCGFTPLEICEVDDDTRECLMWLYYMGINASYLVDKTKLTKTLASLLLSLKVWRSASNHKQLQAFYIEKHELEDALKKINTIQVEEELNLHLAVGNGYHIFYVGIRFRKNGLTILVDKHTDILEADDNIIEAIIDGLSTDNSSKRPVKIYLASLKTQYDRDHCLYFTLALMERFCDKDFEDHCSLGEIISNDNGILIQYVSYNVQALTHMQSGRAFMQVIENQVIDSKQNAGQLIELPGLLDGWSTHSEYIHEDKLRGRNPYNLAMQKYYQQCLRELAHYLQSHDFNRVLLAQKAYACTLDALEKLAASYSVDLYN